MPNFFPDVIDDGNYGENFLFLCWSRSIGRRQKQSEDQIELTFLAKCDVKTVQHVTRNLKLVLRRKKLQKMVKVSEQAVKWMLSDVLCCDARFAQQNKFTENNKFIQISFQHLGLKASHCFLLLIIHKLHPNRIQRFPFVQFPAFGIMRQKLYFRDFIVKIRKLFSTTLESSERCKNEKLRMSGEIRHLLWPF